MKCGGKQTAFVLLLDDVCALKDKSQWDTLRYFPSRTCHTNNDTNSIACYVPPHIHATDAERIGCNKPPLVTIEIFGKRCIETVHHNVRIDRVLRHVHRIADLHTQILLYLYYFLTPQGISLSPAPLLYSQQITSFLNVLHLRSWCFFSRFVRLYLVWLPL